MPVVPMPSPHSREAPCFATDHSGFVYFFDDVQEFATRAGLNADKAIEWACRYAGAESDTWKHLECVNRGQNAPAPTLNDFRDQVRTLYPHLDATRRYTTSDLQRVVDRARNFHDMSRKDLGEYLRDFIKVSVYLVGEGRLSEREQSSKFLEGFPQPIRAAVMNRLAIAAHDVLPDDGYPFKTIQSAAGWVLASRAAGVLDPSFPSTPSRAAVESPPYEEIIRAVSSVMASNNQLPNSAQPQHQFAQQPYVTPQQFLFPQQFVQQQPQFSTQQYAVQPQFSTPQYALHPQFAPQPSQPLQHQSQFVQQPLHPQAQFQSQQRPQFAQQFQRPATPGGVLSNPPRRNQASSDCVFCSDPTHYIKECPLVQQYLVEGKINRDADFRIRLPNGHYPPNHLPGRNMSERVDSWYARENMQRERPANPVLSTNFLESIDESVFAVNYDPQEDSRVATFTSSEDISRAEQVRILKAQLASIEERGVVGAQKEKKKVRFDGVEVPPAPYTIGQRSAPAPSPSTTTAPASPAPATPAPTILARPRPPLPEKAETRAPSSWRREEKSRDRSTERPRGPMRPLVDQRRFEHSKPSNEEPRTRFQSAIESSVNVSELTDRVLDATISVTARELLAASGGVRNTVKDLVASRKVSVNLVEEDLVDSYLAQCFDSNTVLDTEQEIIQVDLFRYEPSSPFAVLSLPLRVIYPDFGNGVFPKCVLDSGAQSILMRRDIWEKIRAPLATNKATIMQSANESRDLTMGMVENLPVTIGEVKVYLQIHVVKTAPFEVLLGRPFFDVTNCSEVSRKGGHHKIHIRNPATGNPYAFPTEPRPNIRLGLPQIKKEDDANFQA